MQYLVNDAASLEVQNEERKLQIEGERQAQETTLPTKLIKQSNDELQTKGRLAVIGQPAYTASGTSQMIRRIDGVDAHLHRRWTDLRAYDTGGRWIGPTRFLCTDKTANIKTWIRGVSATAKDFALR